MNNELAKQTQAVSIYSDTNSFEHAQRIAKMLCTSTMIPSQYQNNMSNTLVALEMSNRIGASPLMVMQNLNVIHGKPSWGSSFIIATINSCGRFGPLQFDFSGTGDDLTCRAITTDKAGNKLVGPPVSIGMAKRQGWFSKQGSKWPDMPELMLSYRAAAFFGRLYCPEIMLGMQTSEELNDIGHVEIKQSAAESINSKLRTAEVQTAEFVEPLNAAAEPVNPATSPVDTTQPVVTSSGAKRTRTKNGQSYPIAAEPPAAAPADEDLV